MASRRESERVGGRREVGRQAESAHNPGDIEAELVPLIVQPSEKGPVRIPTEEPCEVQSMTQS
jgi:hypothetical protein